QSRNGREFRNGPVRTWRGAPQCEPCPNGQIQCWKCPAKATVSSPSTFPTARNTVGEEVSGHEHAPRVPGSERGTLNNLGSIASVSRLFPVPRSQLAVT